MSTLRTNYVTNPSIELATTGWNRTDTCVGTATISRVSGGQVGSYGLEFAYTAENGDTAGSATQYSAMSDVGTATQGEVWTVSAYVKLGAGTTAGVSVFVRIAYYQSDGTYIGQLSLTDIVGELTSAYKRFSHTGTLPADPHISRVAAQLVVTKIANGDAFDLISDGWLLEKSDSMGSYFDGSTEDTGEWTYDWTGAAHASTSIASTDGEIPFTGIRVTRHISAA